MKFTLTIIVMTVLGAALAAWSWCKAAALGDRD